MMNPLGEQGDFLCGVMGLSSFMSRYTDTMNHTVIPMSQYGISMSPNLCPMSQTKSYEPKSNLYEPKIILYESNAN
jgi:hypothetical protein